MVHGLDIRETLEHAHRVLHDLRRKVAAAGHTQSLHEIDSLVAVAEQEAERRLGEMEPKQQRANSNN